MKATLLTVIIHSDQVSVCMYLGGGVGVGGDTSPCQDEQKKFFWKDNSISVQAFPRTES